MKILVEVSAGELIDKILEIKLANIRDVRKRANVAREYAALTEARRQDLAHDPALLDMRPRLRGVNADLWRIEEEIRACERDRRSDADFVALARSVYRTNDMRAELKRQINTLTRSEIVEEKSYGLLRISENRGIRGRRSRGFAVPSARSMLRE